jgi:hypothetical protein
MKCFTLITALLILTTHPAFATCNLSQFRWECEMQLNNKPTRATPSMVQCGLAHGYVSHAEYDALVRFQRANVDMNLTVDDDYMDGPCIPVGR